MGVEVFDKEKTWRVGTRAGDGSLRRTRSRTTADALQCSESVAVEEATQSTHTEMLARQTSHGADTVANALLMYKTSVDVNQCNPLGEAPSPRCQHSVVNIAGGLLYLGGVDHACQFSPDAFVAHFQSGYRRIPTIQLQVNAVVESPCNDCLTGALRRLLCFPSTRRARQAASGHLWGSYAWSTNHEPNEDP